MKKAETFNECHTRLVNIWENSSQDERLEGFSWYPRANAEINWRARQLDVSSEIFTGVVAAISPGLIWSKNIEQAELFIKDQSAKVGSYGGRNREKARRIIAGKDPLTVLGGLKTKAFYQNLLCLDNDAVTVDRHVHYAAWGIEDNFETQSRVGTTEYEVLANYIRKIAWNFHRRPYEVQATIWVTWRNHIKRITES